MKSKNGRMRGADFFKQYNFLQKKFYEKFTLRITFGIVNSSRETTFQICTKFSTFLMTNWYKK